jgi:hypothetical protein
MAEAGTKRDCMVVGVLAAQGIARDLADDLAEDLPTALRDRFDGAQWRAEVTVTPPVEPTATSRELVEAVRRHLLSEGWDLGIGLTDLPLRAGHRPVSAHASATHGVGLVSVPALGAVRLRRRLRSAVLHVVDGLLGEAVGRGAGRSGRDARMSGRLRELASPLGRARGADDGTIRFAGATLRGNARLLLGMIRANRPLQLLARLSGALLGALGTAAVALASSNFWSLADGMSWARLILLTLASVVLIVVALVLAHGLWERAVSPVARERVMLFNFATVATLSLGVAALYLALFVIDLAAAAALIPPSQFTSNIRHDAGLDSYVKLAWLVASLATVGGALGSLVESDDAVRAATYGSHADARTEAGEDAGAADGASPDERAGDRVAEEPAVER